MNASVPLFNSNGFIPSTSPLFDYNSAPVFSKCANMNSGPKFCSLGLQDFVSFDNTRITLYIFSGEKGRIQIYSLHCSQLANLGDKISIFADNSSPSSSTNCIAEVFLGGSSAEGFDEVVHMNLTFGNEYPQYQLPLDCPFCDLVILPGVNCANFLLAGINWSFSQNHSVSCNIESAQDSPGCLTGPLNSFTLDSRRFSQFINFTGSGIILSGVSSNSFYRLVSLYTIQSCHQTAEYDR